jgi:PEP-CTERM motif
MKFAPRLCLVPVLTALCSSAWAVPLAADPGRTTLSGTTAALQPQLPGTVLEDRVVPFSFALPVVLGVGGGTVSGSIQERVVRSTSDGTLDFYWRVFNDATSKQPIGKVLVDHFVASTYDGDWRIDGLGQVGARYGTHAADLVTFSFDDIFDIIRIGGIAPGSSSNFFYLDTQATSYADTGTVTIKSFCTGDVSSFCFGGQSSALSTFAPSAVPEPSTGAMLMMGLLAGGVLLKRRVS